MVAVFPIATNKSAWQALYKAPLILYLLAGTNDGVIDVVPEIKPAGTALGELPIFAKQIKLDAVVAVIDEALYMYNSSPELPSPAPLLDDKS